MADSVAPDVSIEELAEQAVALLKQWQAGDAAVLARVRQNEPQHTNTSEAHLIDAANLMDCKVVLAREYGFRSWQALQLAVQEARAVTQLFNTALIDYTGSHPTNTAIAGQLLVQVPRLAKHDVWAAATLADVAALRTFLGDSPGLTNQLGGPNNWPPLLYLCYSRVTELTGDALAAANLLLERGADANAAFDFQDCHFTAISGAIGEGEASASYWPPHPVSRPLVELLLNNGADPNDGQGLYNSMFSGGTHWLELLIAHGLNSQHKVNWVPDSPTGMLDYLLVQACKYDQPDRARLLLEHKADPDAACFYDKQPCYLHAVGRGNTAVAELLVQYGGQRIEPRSEQERFMNACMASDDATLAAMQQQHPQDTLKAWARNSVSKLEQAAAIGKQDAVSTMLQLGVPIGDALFEAAWNGHSVIAELLITSGARVRQRHTVHHVTPIAYANRAGHHALRDLLLGYDADIFDAIRFERPDRVSEILAGDPDALERPLGNYGGDPKRATETPLIAAVTHGGLECVRILLASGAKTDAVDSQGRSAAQIAAAAGFKEIAGSLASHTT